MRLVIAGSRSLTSWALFEMCVQRTQFATPCTILSGTARGVDSLNIDVEWYPAEWQRYGKRAGLIRNATMLDSELASL